jgi:ribosomal protein S1
VLLLQQSIFSEDAARPRAVRQWLLEKQIKVGDLLHVVVTSRQSDGVIVDLGNGVKTSLFLFKPTWFESSWPVISVRA